MTTPMIARPLDTLAGSLHALAERLDGDPLAGRAVYPEHPADVVVFVRDACDVVTFADRHGLAFTQNRHRDRMHTRTTLRLGRVELDVVHVMDLAS